MGPFPHDAPPATISEANPAGTDGFAFVEFAHPEPGVLEELMRTMGFAAVARHKRRAVTAWKQGDVVYLTNAEPEAYAARFLAKHGPCAVGMGWHVVDPAHAHRRSLELGAKDAPRGRAPWRSTRPRSRGSAAR